MSRIAGANLIGAIWIAWTIYWLIAAQSAKHDTRRESPGSRASHIIPLMVAAWLLWSPRLPAGFLGGRFLPAWPATFWIGVAILIAGLGFSVWARHVLGRNWSGIVTVKQDHELIEQGPYRWVRHPIYTGLLIGFLGTAIARGEWRGLFAVVIVFAALWRKLKLEEQWMIETFGDAYLRYRERVRALIPFVL
jgi:protein-S-isoprenylcysteine O-methyltransferase Ste14